MLGPFHFTGTHSGTRLRIARLSAARATWFVEAGLVAFRDGLACTQHTVRTTVAPPHSSLYDFGVEELQASSTGLVPDMAESVVVETRHETRLSSAALLFEPSDRRRSLARTPRYFPDNRVRVGVRASRFFLAVQAAQTSRRRRAHAADETTKTALESRRIATAKIEWCLGKPSDLRRTELNHEDHRIFPARMRRS